jgi:peptidoglycan/xylan/chitin deacetylase (PgdA/CDA1 family)
MRSFLKYYIKQTISSLFFLFGGIYFIKYRFRKTSVLLILNYHNFSKYNNYKIKRGNILETGYAKNFENQIRFLKKHFNFCYPEEFFGGKCKKGINLLITFDDGYKDNYDIAVPILRKYNIPTIFFLATKYIINNDFLLHDKVRYLIQENLIDSSYSSIPTQMYLGKNNYNEDDAKEINKVFAQHSPNIRLMMNIDEVKKLIQYRFKIGNHTHDHIGLSFYSKTRQEETINTAHKIIEENLQVKDKYIAYPNGLFDKNTLEILRDLNIKYGFTIIGGDNKLGDSKYKLKRIGINVSDSVNFMIFKIFLYLTIKKGKIK